MNKITFRILSVPDDQTFEVRPIIDDVDWIGDDYLGLDPPDLVREFAADRPEYLTLGRCRCGVLGCADFRVDVKRTAYSVEWSDQDRRSVLFDAEYYESRIKLLAQDYSWEPVGRTVERRLNEMFFGMATDDGYHFDWSSTRIRPGLVVLSATKDTDQKLLEFSWDGKTIASALSRGKAFLRERFESE